MTATTIFFSDWLNIDFLTSKFDANNAFWTTGKQNPNWASFNIANNVKVIVRAKDNEDLVVLEKSIKELPGVDNAFIRAYSNGKGVIEVEGSLKPVQIFKALREKMSIFMENTADNTLEISI